MLSNLFGWLFADRKSVTRAEWNQLLDRMEGLERGQRGLGLEWTDTQTKLLKALGRIHALIKRETPEEPPEAEEERPQAAGPDRRLATHAEMAAHRARRFGGLLR